jgi:hypothetical protein
MNAEMVNALLLLSKKEVMLSEIVVWLKAKGLWEACRKDVMLKVDDMEE